MDRRNFIKLTAVTGTSATLASCGNPEHHLIRFLPEEELVPGVAEWKPSVCPLCHAGCGLMVRVMEGEAEVIRQGQTGLIRMGLAKKLEGNPAHPISQGKLCARGQAAIQVTYHPDRIRQPLKRTGGRGSGQFAEISWDDALKELVGQLDALVAGGNQQALAFLKRPATGMRGELVSQFLTRFGAQPPISFELFSDQVLRSANSLSFGKRQLPTFDLANARYVLSFGTDFLGTWNSPVAQSVAYGHMRQGRPGIRGTFVQLEPRMSQTGASADQWIPLRPGTDGIVALGLAHTIMQAGLRPTAGAGRAGVMIEGWSGGLAGYSPAEVERQTGVGAAKLERLARDLVEQQPSVVMVGGAAVAQTSGLFAALAVNALNALLGSVGEPGGLTFMPQIPSLPAANQSGPVPLRSVSALAANILGADRPPVQVLLVDDVNPVFATPPAWRVREALLRVPFIASFGTFLDETSVLADLILPDHSFLESWIDRQPESGAAMAVASVAAPTMRPLHQTRAMPDVLLEISRTLARPLTPAFEWQTFDEMLMQTVSALGSSSDDVWSMVQQQGGWWGDPVPRGANASVPRRANAPVLPSAKASAEHPLFPPHTAGSREAQFDGDVTQYPFHFLPYPSQAFLDGSLAHLPWLQELPDVMTTAMWSCWIEINPRTAERLGISLGDIVEVTSSQGTLRVPALLSPGIAPDVVAMPVGQGHETFTRYASGRGQNPIKLLAALTEPVTGALAWAATRVRIARVQGATGELILFAGEMRERPNEGVR
jgi:anaerobic selenocysteine-containing dehydrogenase